MDQIGAGPEANSMSPTGCPGACSCSPVGDSCRTLAVASDADQARLPSMMDISDDVEITLVTVSPARENSLSNSARLRS